MPAPVEFWFEFSSPYGYFASTRIDALAARHGRDAIWRPFLLGAVFRHTGGQPLPSIPLKGDYTRRDIARTARLHGIPYREPDAFPIASQAPARAFYWLADRDAAGAKRLAAALYHAYMVDNRDISRPEVTVEVAAEQGLDGAAVAAALEDPAVKLRLKEENDAAIARGVFGSPFFIADGEPFWGFDRMDMLGRWLTAPF